MSGIRHEDAMSMFEDWISRSGTTANLEANVDDLGRNKSIYVSAHTRGMFKAFIAGLREGMGIIELALEKAREQTATYRGMYECQKQYSDNVVENYCKLESENKALRERVRKWEEFTREWAEDASPVTEAMEG